MHFHIAYTNSHYETIDESRDAKMKIPGNTKVKVLRHQNFGYMLAIYLSYHIAMGGIQSQYSFLKV